MSWQAVGETVSEALPLARNWCEELNFKDDHQCIVALQKLFVTEQIDISSMEIVSIRITNPFLV